jgi:hypothetical protein
VAHHRGEIRPYRQGDMDGLCGLYAVINAVRLVAAPHRRLDDDACDELFAKLVGVLARHDQLRQAVSSGLARDDVARLLEGAQRWLDRTCDLQMTVNRPAKGSRRLAGKASLGRLTEHLDQLGVAIVDADGHWTVARGTEGLRLVVLDSSGQRYVRLAGNPKSSRAVMPVTVTFLLAV